MSKRKTPVAGVSTTGVKANETTERRHLHNGDEDAGGNATLPVRPPEGKSPSMRAALHEALSRGLDAHWLVPAVPGVAKTGKAPMHKFKLRAPHTLADEEQLWKQRKPAGVGLGMRTGAVVAVDYDPPTDARARAHCEAQLARLGCLVAAPTVRTGGGGLQWHRRWPNDDPPGSVVIWRGAREHEEIRLLGHQGNAVLPPTLHYSGNRYEWGPGHLEEASPALIEAATAARVADATDDDAAALEAHALDLSSLPAALRQQLERAGANSDRSAGIYAATCALKERGYAAEHALWLATESGMAFCTKADEVGDTQMRRDVLRIWRKHEAARVASAAADFASSPAPLPSDDAEDDDVDLAALELPRLPDAALYGVLGELVGAATAHSEATRPGVAAAALVHFAARYGRALGIDIGDDLRSLPLYAVVVGPTGVGRKGTSSRFAAQLFEDVDRLLAAGWGDDTLAPRSPSVPPLKSLTIVSSGQGLIERVRDDGTAIHRTLEREIPGVEDKRLLLDLSEFGYVFASTAQESSTLSMVLRDAYDGKDLDNPTRTNPLHATAPHFCILARITAAEFRKWTVDNKRSTEATNGLLNRFVVLFSVRDRVVSEPRPVPYDLRLRLANKLAANVHAAFHMHWSDHRSRRSVVLRLTDEARELWRTEYQAITTARYDSPTVAALMGRREANTLVIAALLAAMNGESAIGVEPLRAALAWGAYVASTVRRVFTTWAERRNAADLRRRIGRVHDKLAESGGVMLHSKLLRALAGQRGLDAKGLLEVVQAMQEASPPLIVVEQTAKGEGGTQYRLR